jgi:putative SOS response-associated peptidase YedK
MLASGEDLTTPGRTWLRYREADMCGRYALTTPPQVLAALFNLHGKRQQAAPRYNVAPTQTMPVIVQRADGTREMVQMRWGLIPSWAKDPTIGSRMINARSETAAEKPAFRSAMQKRRCLVPISGFYEWQKRSAGGKQPYYIHRADGEPIALAGLWESWTNSETGEKVETFTILTTNANDEVAPLHDRMPVVIEQEDFGKWLDPAMHDSAKASELLQPAADGVLAMHPVSSRVNTPKNDDAALIEPVADGEAHEPAKSKAPKERKSRQTDTGGLFDAGSP